MKNKQNTLAKVMASVALWAIIASIIWTGLLFVFSSPAAAPSQEQTLTQEEIDQIIQNYSGSVVDVQQTDAQQDVQETDETQAPQDASEQVESPIESSQETQENQE